MRGKTVSRRVMMLFFSNAILSAMGFAYRMALTREAGAAALGLNSLVMQIYGMVVSVCISGLNVAVSALAARSRRDETGVLLRSALIVYSGLWVSAAVPVMLFRVRLCASVLGDEKLEQTLVLMLFCIFMTGLENVLKSVHFGTGNVGRCAASELTEQAVRFVLVIILLRNVFRPDDSRTVFLITLGMTLSEFVSVSFLSVSYLSIFGFAKGGSKKLCLQSIVRTAFPATLTSAASTAFASVASLVLPSSLEAFGMDRASALAEIGIMNTAAVPLTMLPMTFVGAAAAVIMPEISLAVSRNESPIPFIKQTLFSTALVGGVSFILLAVFGESISKALFRNSQDNTVFILLSVKALIIYFQVVSVAVLNGMMKQKTVLLFAVAGEAYQLLLILLLAPVLGMIGYAAGMIIGELARLALNLTAVSVYANNSGFYGRDMLKSGKKTIARGVYGKKGKAGVSVRL